MAEVYLSGNGYRILLVDDEAGIRKILRIFFEMEGFTVFEAVSAVQAKEVMERERPHAAILDVVLCGQTGFDVCSWIKQSPELKSTKVVMFTALNQDNDFIEGQRVGCDHYLTKPQNPKEIVEKLKKILGIPEPIEIDD